LTDNKHENHRDVFDKWQEYGIDIPKRRILLDDGLDTIVIARIVANLLWLDKSDGEIDLWINSPGGYVTGMWAIYDVMQQSYNKINTVGIGEISSAAVLLLACGTGTRKVMPNSLLMHHAAQHHIRGNQWELEDYTEASGQEEERRLRSLASHTNTTYRDWKRKSVGEWYMTAEEMVKAGVVDEIYNGK
jgi:ATP-dependent Clp protease protease subunit